MLTGQAFYEHVTEIRTKIYDAGLGKKLREATGNAAFTDKMADLGHGANAFIELCMISYLGLKNSRSRADWRALFEEWYIAMENWGAQLGDFSAEMPTDVPTCPYFMKWEDLVAQDLHPVFSVLFNELEESEDVRKILTDLDVAHEERKAQKDRVQSKVSGAIPGGEFPAGLGIGAISRKGLDDLRKHMISAIAQAAYAVMHAYGSVIGDETVKTPWAELTDDQRFPTLFVTEGLMYDPPRTPRELHEKWYEEKLAQGWKFGSQRDAEQKMHPNCVPYDQLPISERVKDAILCAVVQNHPGFHTIKMLEKLAEGGDISKMLMEVGAGTAAAPTSTKEGAES